MVKRKRRTKATTTNHNNNNNNNKGFRSWLEATHADDVVHRDETFMIIDNLSEHVSPVSCTCIMELFGVYIKFLRCGSGNLSTLWMLYMDTIDILLGLIRASREGDWMIHLASVRAMIPWCFAYDRLNYARYLPCYNALMSQLPTTHPYVHTEFMQEGVSSQAWLQQPLRKNPCRSNDRRYGEQGHTDARGTKRFSLKPWL